MDKLTQLKVMGFIIISLQVLTLAVNYVNAKDTVVTQNYCRELLHEQQKQSGGFTGDLGRRLPHN